MVRMCSRLVVLRGEPAAPVRLRYLIAWPDGTASHAEVDLNMLNSIWLRQPYGFEPEYAKQVNTYLNASARVFDSAQQVCAATFHDLLFLRRTVVAGFR